MKVYLRFGFQQIKVYDAATDNLLAPVLNNDQELADAIVNHLENRNASPVTYDDLVAAIQTKVNLENYDGLEVGQYIATVFGDFICVSKPSDRLPVGSRRWVFDQTTDADGEPLTFGRTVIVNLALVSFNPCI